MTSLADRPVADAAGSPKPAAPPTSRIRLTPNLFATAFGIAGLAQSWTTASDTTSVPTWPADVLWILSAAVWVVTLVLYGHNVVVSGRVRTEITDHVFAPFLVLISITPMILGTVLAGHAHTAGVIVFTVFFVLTVLFGGWISGQWIVSESRLVQWHPGYFLPTVAAGLIASACCSELGYAGWARVMFGYGIVCWLALGSILLLRLFTEPMVPPPLLPTIAIEMAPPVVGGTAWFLINNDHIDAVALGVAGYALLMAMVQLRLVPIYLKVPFGPGWWAFSFSYAAAFTFAIRWLDVDHVSGQRPWTYVLLALITAGIGMLTFRTVSALARGRYLPGRPATQPVNEGS